MSNGTPDNWGKGEYLAGRPPLDPDPLYVAPVEPERTNDKGGWLMVALVVIGVAALIAREAIK